LGKPVTGKPAHQQNFLLRVVLLRAVFCADVDASVEVLRPISSADLDDIRALRRRVLKRISFLRPYIPDLNNTRGPLFDTAMVIIWALVRLYRSRIIRRTDHLLILQIPNCAFVRYPWIMCRLAIDRRHRRR
jgi:hypothetical protein